LYHTIITITRSISKKIQTMKLHSAVILLLAAFKKAKAQTTCEFSVAAASCDAAAVREAINTDCPDVEVPDNVCDTDAEFGEIFNRSYQANKNYMDGGGEFNDCNDDVESLSSQAGRILRFQHEMAETNVVAWPRYEAISGNPDVNAGEGYDPSGYMSNFNLDEGCDTNAVVCCFIVADCDGTDADAEEAAPFEDNTDACGHDLGESRQRNHVKGGWAVYKGSETPTYCHGFFWGNDEASESAQFKGNALFAASYLTTVKSGYTKNIPGAPMCACANQMPIISNAACLEATVTDNEPTYDFTVSPDGYLKTKVTDVSVSVAACAGVSSLAEAYAASDLVTDAQKEKFAKKVLGTDDCGTAEVDFLNEKFYVPGEKESPVDTTMWQQFVGERSYYMTMIGESALRALYDSSETKIIRRHCMHCVERNNEYNYKDLYYRRLERKEFPVAGEFEILDMFMNSFKSGIEIDELTGEAVAGTGDNVLGTHFGIWETYEGALAGDPATVWKCCAYDDANQGYGFPAKCGPSADLQSNDNATIPMILDKRVVLPTIMAFTWTSPTLLAP
jgi:hypothetical protein